MTNYGVMITRQEGEAGKEGEPPTKEELPERIGTLVGAVLLIGICMLIAWPLARRMVFGL